ncbi:MAG TPA: hypothetical protein VLG67_04610 [Candidatus Saccharimonadales bacterium]|nr:hypothetical protein [Candidatus Saccharimonadales bacterium]
MGEPLAYSFAPDFKVPKEPISSGEPLLFRGHRLLMLYQITVQGYTPDGVARATRKKIARGSCPFTKFGLDYRVDALGPSDIHAQEFESDASSALRTFLEAASSHPVILAEDIPDKLCAALSKGAHCDKVPSIQAAETPVRDAHYLNAFLQFARKLKGPGGLKPEDITVIDGVASYSNAEPREVHLILTTAGVIKKVLPRYPELKEKADGMARFGPHTVEERLWTKF